MKYTDKIGSDNFKKDDIDFFNKINDLNSFMGGSLINIQDIKLTIKNS